MADESSDVNEQDEQESADAIDAPPSAPDAATDGVDEADETAGDEPAQRMSVETPVNEPPRRSSGRLTLNRENEAVLGYLTISYPERDVSVLVDGDAAMRILTAHARRRTAGLGDLIDPTVSSALAGWVTLDVESALAVSWMPGLPSRAPRMAVDPAVAAPAA